MDSINKNPPEDHHHDLGGTAAIKKMTELIKEAQTCFFCTNERNGSVNARPRNVLYVDEQGNLWFLSASDSHKNQELMDNPALRLFFQGSPHSVIKVAPSHGYYWDNKHGNAVAG